MPKNKRSGKNVLVLAAHPDDEVLGCGGAIAKHVASGDVVDVVILAEGVTSRGAASQKAHASQLGKLRKCAEAASAILGVRLLSFHTFPDNRMDSVDLLDVVKTIEIELVKSNPSIVYTHHTGDVNIDHRVIHDAVIAACRPQPGHCVRELLFFETPSSTEWRPPSSGQVFAPNWFVDISETLPLKLKALAAYKPELRAFPHPRSPQAVEHLARWRGATVGVVAAEAFMLGRKIT